MGKYGKKKKKSNAGQITAIVVIFLITLVAFVLFVMPRLLYGRAGDGDSMETIQTEPSTALETVASEVPEAPGGAAVEFPLKLENGSLEIESLFQFDGINPDAGNQQGTNIASILLKNTSDAYLSEANISLTMADGTVLNFTATDVPAGMNAMAFSTENQSIEADAACTGVECKASFADITAIPEQIEVSAEGTVITLTNTSDQDLKKIVVYCRCPLGEEYFGGITYQYVINDLPAGETATVDAVDCILGMAEVVRIAMN